MNTDPHVSLSGFVRFVLPSLGPGMKLHEQEEVMNGFGSTRMSQGIMVVCWIGFYVRSGGPWVIAFLLQACGQAPIHPMHLSHCPVTGSMALHIV